VRRRNTFCYIDARDLGQIVDLYLQKDDLGFQIFNVGNDHNGANIPSKELAERFFKGVTITRALGEHEALFSNQKIHEVIGFKEEHNWWKYVKEN
jgi:nucleoside-diphosphate-sugar epimerase